MSAPYIHPLYDAAANGTGVVYSSARRGGHIKTSVYVLWLSVAAVSRITVTVEGRQQQGQTFTPLATLTEADFTLGRMGGVAHIDGLQQMQEMRATVADMSASQACKVLLETA